MMKDWNDLKKEIIDRDLCCLCGTCVGMCPTKTLSYSDGKIENSKNKCVGCGLCSRVCPGGEFQYSDYNRSLFNCDAPPTALFGFYRFIRKGYSLDPYVRERASSGGLATQLACFMLEERLADSVIGVVSEGTKNSARILTSREQVLTAMQSKYVFVPLNEILRTVREREGKYLYVGLPCQVQGLRRAMGLDPVIRERIVMTAGIFCGFNMTEEATDFLIRKSGIRKEDISSVEYRGKKNGTTGFRLTGREKEFFISKHGYTILNIFFSRPRCWKCYDLTAEFADISFGDAWEMETGWSRIIVRSEAAEKVFLEMERKGKIRSLASCEEDMLHSQKQLLFYKKLSIGERKKRMKSFPEYGQELPDCKGVRKLKAALFLYALYFGNTKAGRIFLNLVPIRLLETLSRKARDGSLAEITRYAFWGVVTVLFSMFSFWALLRTGIDYKTANLTSILLTKMEAYLTNKYFVFKSKNASVRELLLEMLRFIGARGLSGIVEFAGLIVLVDLLGVRKMIGKGVMIVITTIMNYMLGKKVVYR